MTSKELKMEIYQENIKIENSKMEAKRLQIEINKKLKLLESIEKQERDEKEKEFINQFLNGLEEKRNDIYIVFNKQTKFIKSINMREEFKYTDEMEKWLKKEKLYAHNLSSFYDRSLAWYDMTLAKQLENLSWEFSKNGNLINTNW